MGYVLDKLGGVVRGCMEMHLDKFDGENKIMKIKNTIL